jgi:hypothetical protein
MEQKTYWLQFSAFDTYLWVICWLILSRVLYKLLGGLFDFHLKSIETPSENFFLMRPNTSSSLGI